MNAVKEIVHANISTYSEWSTSCEEEGAQNISNKESVFSSVYFAVLDYKLLGPTRAAVGTPQLVLKARRRKDRRIVFINICTCEEIPLPPAGSRADLFYFVASKQLSPSKSVAVDLFLNPQTYRMDDVDSVRFADRLSQYRIV